MPTLLPAATATGVTTTADATAEAPNPNQPPAPAVGAGFASTTSHTENRPTDQTTASDAAPGNDQSCLAPSEYSIFYNDQSRITPKEKMAYIIMLMCNFENLMLTHKDDHTTPDYYTNNKLPYSEFINTPGWKSKLIASKKVIPNEIRCQKPHAKTNYKTFL